MTVTSDCHADQCCTRLEDDRPTLIGRTSLYAVNMSFCMAAGLVWRSGILSPTIFRTQILVQTTWDALWRRFWYI